MTTLTILGHALLSAAAPGGPELDAERLFATPEPAPAAIALPESALSSVAAAYARQERVGSGTYFRVNAGLVTTEESDGPDEEIDFDEGYLVALAIGRRMTTGATRFDFDLELEGVWNDQDADDDGPIQAVEDVTVAGVFLNGVFDIRLAQRIALYAGAGIGSAWMDIGTESDAVNDFDDEDGPFLAWQAKVGLNWMLTDTMSLQTGYRFLNIDDVEIDDDLGGAGFDLETRQHVAEVGLRFSF